MHGPLQAVVHDLCYTVHLFEMSQQKLGTFWENELFQNLEIF